MAPPARRTTHTADHRPMIGGRVETGEDSSSRRLSLAAAHPTKVSPVPADGRRIPFHIPKVRGNSSKDAYCPILLASLPSITRRHRRLRVDQRGGNGSEERGQRAARTYPVQLSINYPDRALGWVSSTVSRSSAATPSTTTGWSGATPPRGIQTADPRERPTRTRERRSRSFDRCAPEVMLARARHADDARLRRGRGCGSCRRGARARPGSPGKLGASAWGGTSESCRSGVPARTSRPGRHP